MYAAKQISPVDDEIAEEWLREIPSPKLTQVHGVGATNRDGGEWAWHARRRARS